MISMLKPMAAVGLLGENQLNKRTNTKAFCNNTRSISGEKMISDQCLKINAESKSKIDITFRCITGFTTPSESAE